MITSVAIEASALDRLQAGFDLSVDWLKNWESQGLPDEIIRIEVEGVVFLFGPRADTDSKLLVIALDNRELFGGLPGKLRPEAFLRVVRAGRAAHSPGSQPLPASWGPFHHQSLVSIQSNHLATGERARIILDFNPRETPHAYAFILDRSKRDLAKISQINYAAFDHALSEHEGALLKMLEVRDVPANLASKMTLGALEDRISMGRSLTDWLKGHLTPTQQAFVQTPLVKSIRLVGAAGTGKTLSLTVKCLSELTRYSTSGRRFLFLTHNQSTVDTIQNAIISMDADGSIRKSCALLRVCTLQELANDAMKFDLHGLEPLSNDGLEGRTMQMEAIGSQIENLRKGDWITYRQGCSAPFRLGVESSRDSVAGLAFAYEIMNEFACVLEADGVRQSADKRSVYVSEHRKAWMMPLPTAEDRRVVLRLYDVFREFLKELGVIGADQMISDYLGFLDSNRWDNVRQREGFDAIFVDELHLFNRQERMTLHHLMRDAGKAPVIVMAYDTKQSVRDTFYGLTDGSAAAASALSKEMGLGQTERFELRDGFRYTTEIARVLEWIDQTFPAVGLSEELGIDWVPLVVTGVKKGCGLRPVLFKAKHMIDIFKAVFPRAERAAKDLKGRRVAVLCTSETLFRKYCEATAYKDSFLAITDREQATNMKHAGKRFVLSMPEFVAGTQFDTVYLIEVNEGEVKQGPYSSSAFRRFVSTIYLGASRAERVLEFYANEERGGPSKVLQHAISNNALDVKELSEL